MRTIWIVDRMRTIWIVDRIRNIHNNRWVLIHKARTIQVNKNNSLVEVNRHIMNHKRKWMKIVNLVNISMNYKNKIRKWMKKGNRKYDNYRSSNKNNWSIWNNYNKYRIINRIVDRI